MRQNTDVYFPGTQIELSSYDIFRAYKDQYGIEQNFGFLQNTPIVNAIFLKKAERIEALAFILLLWQIPEFVGRVSLFYKLG